MVSFPVSRGLPAFSNAMERIVDSSSSAEIYVTKLAAARRQLCTAIRLFFAREDELAIHTITSAAYRVIRDLKSQRGHDEVGDYYLTMVFYVVRDYRRGSLPSYMAEDPETMKWIRLWAEQLPITKNCKYEDIRAFASPEVAREFWNKYNKVSNFLKHADRDGSAHISMKEVNNLPLLMQAQTSYFDLDRDGLGYEGLVFWIYSCVNSGMIETLPTELLEIATCLESLSCEERLKRCSALLNDLKGRENDA